MIATRTKIGWPAACALAAGLAAASASASPSPTPCDAIVRAARATAVKPITVNRIVDLERLLPASVGTRTPTSHDPEVLARAKAVIGSDELAGLEVQPVAPGLWRVQRDQGTLHCTDDAFFRETTKGKTRRVPTPPPYAELCYAGRREMRTGPNGSALVEIEAFDRPDLGLDVEVTPWSGGWGKACRASLRFTDSFRVTERFCGDKAICAAGARAAPRLAARIARAGDGDPPGQTSVAMNYPDGRGALATFGARARTEFTDYSDTQGSFAVTIAGRPLVAHVGIGGVAWRAMGDYLVTLYPPGDSQHPLAGFVVERRVAGLKSATTSIPEPWVNPH